MFKPKTYMSSARCNEVIQRLSNSNSFLRVSGIESPAQAYFIARLFQESNYRRILILAADPEEATALHEEIEIWNKILSPNSKDIPHALLSEGEVSPYSSIETPFQEQIQSVAFLSKVLFGPEPRFIIGTMASALRQRLSPASWRDLILNLKVGEEIRDRSILRARFSELGYVASETVEDPGQFTIRGEIIDFFPLDREWPIRIELFDTVIEKIRSFEPTTQISQGENITHVEVPPAKEFPMNAVYLKNIRESVRTFCEDHGIPRPKRDPWLERLFVGTYPSGYQFWTPFASTENTTVLDLYQPDLVIVLDPIKTQQNWDSLREEYDEEYETSLQQGRILPPPQKLFKTVNLEKLDFPSLLLDQLNLITDITKVTSENEEEGPKEEKNNQVSIRRNTDFIHLDKESRFQKIVEKIRLWKDRKYAVYIFTRNKSQRDRLEFLLNEHSVPASEIIWVDGVLREGFRWYQETTAVLTDHEIFGQKKGVARKSKSDSWSDLQTLSDLNTGDCVVHMDHGIGIYRGLHRIKTESLEQEYLLIEYAQGDKLYLPVYRLNVIQRYSGDASSAAIDRLGSQNFQKAKEKAKESVQRLALDLVGLYAQRAMQQGIQLSPKDGAFQDFEGKFPYQETEDQQKAIDHTLADLESGRIMDRLICGDVGYGKTEVAMRAAFRMVSEGYQVAVLVPTTILAQQHEHSFRQRMRESAIRIESVSRFKNSNEQKEILQELKQGKVDIIIGTHRLLSKDVQFSKLGMVIIDEEQRFGVEHKEKLKLFRLNTHVLTLSATPIPRTLHMALSGLREISLIHTAPIDRLPIKTYLAPLEEEIVVKAIRSELQRGGQVFFVHNRVQSIQEIAKQVQEWVPEAKIGIGHGQMSETELEEVMKQFISNQTNVLVSTSIIESGLDIPNSNTIIINRADHFGLSQLYQLRGRVGRSQRRAYAYLLIPNDREITQDARKRLEVIQKFVELGSGFQIASHDLEIRGGGDLLGASQSGHIAAVGFEMYTELLEEAIREMKHHEKPLEVKEPEIKVPYSAYLGENFIPDVHARLSLYRRLSSSKDSQEVDQLETEMTDRFGSLTVEAEGLLWLIRTKILLKNLRIEGITASNEKIVLHPGTQSLLSPEKAIALLASKPKQYQITPDSKWIMNIPTRSLKDIYFEIQRLFDLMSLPS